MDIYLFRKIKKAFALILIAGAFLSAIVQTTYGAEAGGGGIYSYEDIDNAYGNTKDLLKDLAQDDGWSSDSVWIVLGLARAGELDYSCAEAYRENILYELQDSESEMLSERQSSDNSRAILALSAAGYDASDVEGYDLTAPLANIAYVKSQGINGPVWALMALDCAGYDIPVIDSEEYQSSRDNLIESILSAAKPDGGWAYSGAGSDVDMTCMALQALSPYYGSDERVSDAVDRALDWLSGVQEDDGSFSSGGVVTSESASQVIVALTSLGIDPESDGRFIKNGRTVLDSLMDFYVRGGGFKHIHENYRQNGIASMQAFYALVSWYRLSLSWSSLYDMRDASQGLRLDISYSSDKDAPPEESVEDEKPEKAADTEAGENSEEDSSKKTNKSKEDSFGTNEAAEAESEEIALRSSEAEETKESLETELLDPQAESILKEAAEEIAVAIRNEETKESTEDTQAETIQESETEKESDEELSEGAGGRSAAEPVIAVILGIPAAFLMGREMKKK